MFRFALLKLTGLYLLLLMMVSVIFSIGLYRISSHEVNKRLQHQVDFFNRQTIAGPLDFSLLPLDEQRQLEEQRSHHHIIGELVYVNVLVLFVGGVGSYLLARRTLKPIEEAHEAQARFTADASHELRTPLATMRTETEVALRDPSLKLKDAKELLQSNLEELTRLGELSAGLLQLARGIDQATVHEALPLKDIVIEAVSQIEHAARIKHIQLDIKKLPDVTITGNHTQLVQLFVILLDNAVKYSNDKTVVTIKGSRDQKHARITVSDHGNGMSSNDLQHIFERFYRADTARSKANTSGYGLGLSIAKQISEAHNSHIEVTSTPKKGSAFSVILPAHKA